MDSSKNIKKKTFSSIMWKGMERFCAQIVSTIVSIVLARILLPEDYSVVSIVAIFFAFCNLFISGGLNSALIQKKNADTLDYSTILITNLGLSVVLYLIMFLCAPLIARLYDHSILIPVIRVMALGFFINGYKAVVCAKISSDLQFKKFFMGTIIGTVISAVVGIAMALSGYGAWALVAQQMSNSLIDAIILTVSTRFVLPLRFSFDRFKGLFGFGGKLFLSSIINTIYVELKPLIVGIKYSTSDLAFYKKGETFPSLINTLTSNTLAAVLFPAMSKMQDHKDALLNVTRRYFKIGTFVLSPVLLGFMTVSDNFIRIVLTDKWLPISPYIRIFCIAYLFNIIQLGCVQAIQAIGRSDILLKLEIEKKLMYFIIVMLFLLFAKSPLLLAASEIICYIVATMINVSAAKKIIGFRFRYLFTDMAPNLVVSIIMCIVVYIVGLAHLHTAIVLMLQVFVGAGLYIGISAITKNQNMIYLLDIIKSYIPKKDGSDRK